MYGRYPWIPADFGRLLKTCNKASTVLSTDDKRLSHSSLDGTGGLQYARDSFVASCDTALNTSPEIYHTQSVTNLTLIISRNYGCFISLRKLNYKPSEKQTELKLTLYTCKKVLLNNNNIWHGHSSNCPCLLKIIDFTVTTKHLKIY